MNAMTSTNTLMPLEREGEGADGYLRIGELARMLGVTLRTLRFYEDKGLIRPHRQGATRLYGRREVARLKLILMGRRVGFSLREVKHMLDLYDPRGSNHRQLRVALEKSERQYAKLERQRQAIEEAMAELTQAMAAIRERLQAAGRHSA
jgi:DNA-binding transcriptional MerR regulator